MQGTDVKRRAAIFLAAALLLSGALGIALARGQTYVSGHVITADGKVVAGGVVALEKGELHNNRFLAGGAIGPDGNFKIPLPSGGRWGLHVYSEGYIYFPLQIQVAAGRDNEVPVILPVDGNRADDPRISDIRFKKISDRVMQISMRVQDPDGNLGPQMLAVDTARFKSYRLVPIKGDLKNKKASFPPGIYVSPYIPVALDGENPGNWLFVVADHQCSNGLIYNGLNKSIYKPPTVRAEKMRCEVAGIWKSNFDKIYRFTPQAPGVFKGEQFEGQLVIDKMVQQGRQLFIDFHFQGQKGKSQLRLVCQDSAVVLKGPFSYPSRSGQWIFAKLKNSAGSGDRGRRLFAANCAACHYADRRQTKVGPGLAGLFKAARLPVSGLRPSEQNLRARIIKGGKKMPPFKHLGADEIAAIIDFLKTQ